MAKPSPTQDQQDAIDSELQSKEDQQTAIDDSAALQDDNIDTKQKVDNAFKALFDYYNDDIIGQYDAERKAINGEFVPSPIVEQDLLDASNNPPSGRLVPDPPVTDIVRIDEFDAAGYTGNTNQNELQHMSNQQATTDGLQNGYTVNGSFTESTIQTNSELNSSSTELDVIDNTNPIDIQVDDELVITDGTTASVVKVTSVTDNQGGDPPYDFTLGIDFILEPSAPIPSGSSIYDFDGFTDSERTNKTASNSDLQPLMDALISALEDALNNRRSRISEQLTALNANEDPDGDTEISTAKTEANDSDSFIDNYLDTTDISDSGLSSLDTERTDRTNFLNTRITQIKDNYTNQTENYYDQRYNVANNRANMSRGTLRELQNAKNTKDQLQNLSNGLQGSIDALNDISS